MSEVLHPSTLPLEQLRSECTVERVRRSGPGGQNRNKVETGVVIRHEPTGVRAEANERRSQAENLAVAWQRLRVRLAVTVRSEAIIGDPSALWRSRVVGASIQVNQGHVDYPALLAEALDALAAADWDIATAVALFGVSRTQFTKLLRREPEAFALLNLERETRGLRRLA